MFTQRQLCLRDVLTFKVTVLVLLGTTGTSEVLHDSRPSTASPSLLNSSLSNQTINGTMNRLKVQLSVRPCEAKNTGYCFNDGKCIYPQDSNIPSCICPPSYSGPRCQISTDFSHQPIGVENVIAIIFGLIIVFLVLALAGCCFFKRKCEKSVPLIKTAASDSFV